MMTIKTIGVLAMGLIAMAFGGQVKENSKVVFSGYQDDVRLEIQEENGEGTLTLYYKGEELSVDLESLEAGSTASYKVGGEVVDLIRQDNGAIKVTVNGKELNVFQGGEGYIWVHGDDGDEHETAILQMDFQNRVTISGLGDLDEDLRDIIIQAIRDAGVEKEVEFLSHHVMTLGNGNIFVHEADAEADVQVFELKSRDKGSVIKIKKGERKSNKY